MPKYNNWRHCANLDWYKIRIKLEGHPNPDGVQARNPVSTKNGVGSLNQLEAFVEEQL